MSFLEKILAVKREEVLAGKKSVPRDRLERMPFYLRRTLSLSNALNGKDLAVIAEIKKASPSKGVLREQFAPVEIAQTYVRAGASALSVLTDFKFFQGRLEYIKEMRDIVSVPILRKDFIVDEYQIHESKAYGADAVLLIVAALESDRLRDLMRASSEIGLECLVEVHNKKEIDSLDFSLVKMVGINNRDLATFETDLTTSLQLKQHIPSDVIVVSESGINSRRDLDQLVKHGIHAVLIGELFMRAEDPGKALAEFMTDEVRMSS